MFLFNMIQPVDWLSQSELTKSGLLLLHSVSWHPLLWLSELTFTNTLMTLNYILPWIRMIKIQVLMLWRDALLMSMIGCCITVWCLIRTSLKPYCMEPSGLLLHERSKVLQWQAALTPFQIKWKIWELLWTNALPSTATLRRRVKQYTVSHSKVATGYSCKVYTKLHRC